MWRGVLRSIVPNGVRKGPLTTLIWYWQSCAIPQARVSPHIGESHSYAPEKQDSAGTCFTRHTYISTSVLARCYTTILPTFNQNTVRK
jgi:hypothetical protein